MDTLKQSGVPECPQVLDELRADAADLIARHDYAENIAYRKSSSRGGKGPFKKGVIAGYFDAHKETDLSIAASHNRETVVDLAACLDKSDGAHCTKELDALVASAETIKSSAAAFFRSEQPRSKVPTPLQ